jgi:hypothetical protein
MKIDPNRSEQSLSTTPLPPGPYPHIIPFRPWALSATSFLTGAVVLALVASLAPVPAALRD